MPPKTWKQLWVSSTAFSLTNARAMPAMTGPSAAPEPRASAAPATRALAIFSARLVRASRCFSPWNDPIGRPIAIRVLEYSRPSLKFASIAPTDSAALSAAATATCQPASSGPSGSVVSMAAAGTRMPFSPRMTNVLVISSPSAFSRVSPSAERGTTNCPAGVLIKIQSQSPAS
jgi:hypothetical protein